MRIKSILLAAIIALGFAACNNEDVPQVEQKNATMSVKITQATSGTRAVGADNAGIAGESEIKKLEVFVFNGDVLDGYDKAEGTHVTEVTDIAVTTGARTIIVVANAPELLGGNNKSTLLAEVAKLKDYQTATSGLLMTAEETESFTIVTGDNYYGYDGTAEGTHHEEDEPIELTRVLSRVALVGAEFTPDTDGPFKDWHFEPTEVYLFNVNETSNYFENLDASDFVSGVELTNGELAAQAYVAADVRGWLQDGYTYLSDEVYYYTFENQSATPTVLTIKGKLKKDATNYATDEDLPGSIDEDGYTYYSILVNGDGYDYSGSEVEKGEIGNGKIYRNTQYNISVKITKPGTPDPTDPPVEDATLNVKVKVVEWEKVNQKVEY